VKLSNEGLRAVAAHECGHVISQHPTRIAVLLGLIASVKFSIGVPLLASLTVLLAFLWMLREWEFTADQRAVELVGATAMCAAFMEYRAIAGDAAEASRFSELLSGYPSITRRLRRIESLDSAERSVL